MLSLKHFTFIINSEAESTCLSFLRDNNLPLPRVYLTLFNYFKCFWYYRTSTSNFRGCLSLSCFVHGFFFLMRRHSCIITTASVQCKDNNNNKIRRKTKYNVIEHELFVVPLSGTRGVYFIKEYFNEMRKRKKKIIHLFGANKNLEQTKEES